MAPAGDAFEKRNLALALKAADADDLVRLRWL